MEDITIKEDKSFDEVTEKNEATEKPEEKPNKSDKSNKSEAPKKESKGKSIAITILSIVVLALSATLAVLLINSKKDNQDNKQNETSKTEEKKEEKANEESPEPITTQEEVKLSDETIKKDIIQKVMALNLVYDDKNTEFFMPNEARTARVSRLYNGKQTDEDDLNFVWNDISKSLNECNNTERDHIESKGWSRDIICKSASFEEVSKQFNKLFGKEAKREITTKGPFSILEPIFVYDSELERYYGLEPTGGGMVPSTEQFLLDDGQYSKGSNVYAYYRIGTEKYNSHIDEKQVSHTDYTLYGDLGFGLLNEDDAHLSDDKIVEKISEQMHDWGERNNHIKKVMEENRSAFARYRFVFKLDNSGTNYIFDHVEKV